MPDMRACWLHLRSSPSWHQRVALLLVRAVSSCYSSKLVPQSTQSSRTGLCAGTEQSDMRFPLFSKPPLRSSNRPQLATRRLVLHRADLTPCLLFCSACKISRCNSSKTGQGSPTCSPAVPNCSRGIPSCSLPGACCRTSRMGRAAWAQTQGPMTKALPVALQVLQAYIRYSWQHWLLQ